jgi:hypothetical protein
MVRRFIQPLSGLVISGFCHPQVSPVDNRVESLRDFLLPPSILLFDSFLIPKELNSNSPTCNAGKTNRKKATTAERLNTEIGKRPTQIAPLFE